MIGSFTSSFMRPLAAGSVAGLLLLMTGCASQAPAYQATNDNVRALQALPGGKVALGQFSVKSEDLNHVTVRGGTFQAPTGSSFSEYLKSALRAELESAGKIDDASHVTITGELQGNELDAAIGTGTARIAARIIVARDGKTVYDKVLIGSTQWESSFLGAIAIPSASQHYADTMKQLIAKLFADQDFQRAL